ncbi:MAG TPA: hypothetical protein VGQ15_05930 [Gaiellaceae bacterium]|jgi:hypothetical protein|nr:hypothetical protein [Gaiellaceae bacterium]
MTVLAFTSSDLAYVALAVFLLATGLTLGYAFLRLGETFGRISAFIKGAQDELLPVINKSGGTVDRVNLQLDKVDTMTDSAVDAVESVDTAIRAVSMAITRPVQKVSGFAAGLAFGISDFKAHRDLGAAIRAGKEAAARREADLEQELRSAGKDV